MNERRTGGCSLLKLRHFKPESDEKKSSGKETKWLQLKWSSVKLTKEAEKPKRKIRKKEKKKRIKVQTNFLWHSGDLCKKSLQNDLTNKDIFDNHLVDSLLQYFGRHPLAVQIWIFVPQFRRCGRHGHQRVQSVHWLLQWAVPEHPLLTVLYW